VHVELLAEHLLDGLDQPRMRAEQTERLVVEVRGEGGARRTGLLAPDFGPVVAVDALRLVAEHGHLVGQEGSGQEQPAFSVKLRDLLVGEPHGETSSSLGRGGP
jgi:hypothetical protein